MEEELNNNVEQNEPIKQVEVITKEPVVMNSKPAKDPKKIAAGKKLAAYNKKAKEDKKKITTSNSNSDEVNNEAAKSGFGFYISLTTIIAILGLGLTAADFYFRFNEKRNGVEDYKMMVIDDDISAKKKEAIKTVKFKQGME